MKLFLSHAGLGEVQGGVENYAKFMKKVFPDLKILDYHSLQKELGDTSFSFLKEPTRAKKLGEYVEKNFPGAEIFSNGMFCWNLKNEKQLNICHGSYAAFASKSIPIINPDYFRLKYIYSHYEKLAAKNSAHVIANSIQTKENIAKYFGLQSHIIYPPVDLDNFKPIEHGKAKSKLRWTGTNVLFVGRPEYVKGFDFLEKLASRNLEINFKCILSRPYKSSLKNVEIIMPKKHSELPLYYCGADLVLFPSRFEGYGFVTVEALACNTKIVTLATGIAPEINSENVFIASNNIESLQKTLLEALKASESKSRGVVEKNFSFKKFKEQWLIYTSKELE